MRGQKAEKLYSEKSRKIKITYASENPTVQKLTSGKKNGKEERNRNGKVRRTVKRNKIGTEKSDERKRGMQEKTGEERAAGEEKIELHVYEVIGRARDKRGEDISWPSSPIGTASCTCLLYTSPSPRDATLSRMPSSA